VAVGFFNIDNKINLKNKKLIRNWIKTYISNYPKSLGEINIILVSDDYLLEMNIKHLGHNYYTDIITFNYNSGNSIAGDLYISIDRVKENASNFNVSVSYELLRIMIHGILHLLGFEDSSWEAKQKMTNEENFALIPVRELEIL
jgi:probable rRNA maturation factor